MTKEEAIEYNKNLREYMRITDKESEYKFLKENYEALDLAIKALEQELSSSEKPNRSEIPTSSDDCISREQAINAFPNLLPNVGYNKKTITEILQDLPSVTPQEPRWIRDSERLPESNGNYLITYCYQNKIETQEAVYIEDEDEAKWFDITGVEITLAVIAWMPLPKAYKIESEE